jgi:ankyrin repeat protein
MNATDNYGMAPLLRAAESGREEVVRGLLEKGDTTDRQEVLLHAAANGEEQVVRLLIQCGCDIHAPDPRGMDVGRTALLSAVALAGHCAIIRMLLALG